MTIDLDKLSSKELRELQKNVARQLEDQQKRERHLALTAAQDAAAEYGFSLEDRMGIEGKAKMPVLPKYADPTNAAQTWSGRGRKPKWVQKHLDDGGSLDDLLIK